MSRRLQFHVLWTVALPFFILACVTSKDKIAQLVESGKYAEANSMINRLSSQDRSGSEMQTLAAKCKAGVLMDSASTLVRSQEFSKAVQLVSDRLDQFSSFPQIQDSLRREMVSWAFAGATSFERNSDPISAYNCIAPIGEISRAVPPNQWASLERLTKEMLSGIWEGRSDKHKIHIRMRIEALTSSSFVGTVLFQEANIYCGLHGGFFNGSELSATYPIYNRPSSMGGYPVTEQGVNGKYDSGTLIMSFPILVTETHTENVGGYTYGSTMYTHVAQETCTMKKTKGL